MRLDETHDDISIPRKTFSNDVLKIEILGPKQEHFSVIDVPGIFKKTTPGVTSKADIEMVRAMIMSYMKNERSVILAVMPANVDIATQEILELAEECDSSGRRTLGVLTKPDLVDKGAEHTVVNIIDGRTHPLNLGWCVVRNAGQQELASPLTDRYHAEELFFKMQEPWSKLSKDRVGIDALRSRLVEILGEMVQREFSKVKHDVSALLKARVCDLERLGPSRESRGQQFKFLLDLSTRCQHITDLALKADYGDEDLFEIHANLRLATAVVNRNEVFSDDMFKRGHTRMFGHKEVVAELVAPPPSPPPQEASQLEDDERFHFGMPNVKAKKSKSRTSESTFHWKGRTTPPPLDLENKPVEPTKIELLVPEPEQSRHRDTSYDELKGILVESVSVAEPNSKPIIPWLTEVYKNSRGFELGTFDASLLTIVWKKQSLNWDALALGYVSDIVDIVHTFTMHLLALLCSDTRVLRGVTQVLHDDLQERYRKAMDHARFLLKVERDGTPMTTNHYFAENLEKNRQERVKARLKKSSYVTEEGDRVVKLDTTIATTTASNLEHTIGDLHDILHSYYKVARKRFVDVVCMQAADYHLVTGPNTPIKVFSPTFVSELSEEQLERIAGEDTVTQRRRMQLKRDIENLEKGMKVLF